MHANTEQSLPEIGTFDFEVYSTGSGRRRRTSTFHIRCDAIGLHDNEILLLSVVGAETGVKALTAGLRASGREQKRIDYSTRVGGISNQLLTRFDGGYRLFRTKLNYGLWHVLCLANRDGFMPVMTEDTVWQQLQSDRFTTPLLREWVPWLCQRLKYTKHLVELTQCGCQAGLLQVDDKWLGSLVCEGIMQGNLRINGRAMSGKRRGTEQLKTKGLDDYMLTYGPLLGKQAERSLEPLHVPGRDPLPELDLVRAPFDAQAHVIEATRKALCRQKSVLVVGEMGTGKTIMAMAAVHAHAQGRPYRTLIFCPGQLVNKWEREIQETVPGAEVFQIKAWTDLLRLDPAQKSAWPEWHIIPRDRAKLGARWQPAYLRRDKADGGILRCPQCGLRLVTEDREPITLGKPGHNGQPGTGLWKRRVNCEWVLTNDRSAKDPDHENGGRLIEGCGAPLWQMNGELWRYEPALFIKRHLRHFFKYLILDEVHEEKGSETAQGHAAGTLAAACQKVLALTGTLIGGYAEHLRPLLFRLSPGSLIQEGLGWSQATAFNERYGRIETRITERSGTVGEDNRMSRGSKSTTKSVRPGVMPTLFGKHLIDKAVFLSLGEVAENLPPLEEECISVAMDAELSKAYKEDVERPLGNAIKEMLKRHDRRLLGAMLQTLLAYPDLPSGWEPIGYFDEGQFVTVATPPNLPDGVIRAKEQALLDLIRSERSKGRKVWVYVQYTDKHDVQGRLETLLKNTGFKVGMLRASVPLARREEWIAANAPNLDVVVSHPRLVETGLDLFDKAGRHNFPTLCFYETGYNLFTLRQASRRSWRIGQKENCRIVYFHYKDTMQERAMALMGKKLTAAQALEGTFSSEGLVAMAGEDANVEIALARSLVERMDEGDTRRMWGKVVNSRPQSLREPDPEFGLEREFWLDVPVPTLPASPLARVPVTRGPTVTSRPGAAACAPLLF